MALNTFFGAIMQTTRNAGLCASVVMLALVAMGGFASNAHAAPSSFTLSAQAYSNAPGGGGQGFFGITSASPLSQTASYSDGPLGASAQYTRRGPSSMSTVAVADTGQLSATFAGSSSSVADPVAGVVAGAQASGSANIAAKWTDFIVSGSGASVSVSFNALFGHSFQFNQQSNLFTSTPGASLFITGVGGSVVLVQSYLTQSTAITSATFTVPVGVPFDISVNMSTSALAAAAMNSAVTNSAQAGLVDTIAYQASFSLGAAPITTLFTPMARAAVDATGAADASSGPVFNLPSGYTINSVQANIVDNMWLGGTLAPVPEPGTLALMVVGLGLVGVASRTRANRPQA